MTLPGKLIHQAQFNRTSLHGLQWLCPARLFFNSCTLLECFMCLFSKRNAYYTTFICFFLNTSRRKHIQCLHRIPIINPISVIDIIKTSFRAFSCSCSQHCVAQNLKISGNIMTSFVNAKIVLLYRQESSTMFFILLLFLCDEQYFPSFFFTFIFTLITVLTLYAHVSSNNGLNQSKTFHQRFCRACCRIFDIISIFRTASSQIHLKINLYRDAVQKNMHGFHFNPKIININGACFDICCRQCQSGGEENMAVVL